MNRLGSVLGAVALLAFFSPTSVLAGGGNSAAAAACQQGGWQTHYRSDGSAFKNTGDCVSYAAHDGVFGSPLTITGFSYFCINVDPDFCVLAIEVFGTGFNSVTPPSCEFSRYPYLPCTAVSFDGQPAAAYTVLSDTEISKINPGGPPCGPPLYITITTPTASATSLVPTWVYDPCA